MFAKEKINGGRQLELDVVRGFAVLFMILIHAQLYFATEKVINSWFGRVIDFLGMIPSAPMFMFLLGVGINYTRKNNPKIFYKRGLMLLAGGYVLNFLRGFLPSLINYLIYKDVSYYYGGVAQLMYVDILQFAGLAMILFGILKRVKANYIVVTLCAIGFSLLNIFMSDIIVENFWLTSLTGLFWGSSDYSYFPFLTWIFYPLAGYLFGSILIRCTDKKRFYKVIAIASALFFFGGTYIFNVVIGLPNGMLTDIGYYHHIITDNITFTAFVILEISLVSFITPFIPEGIKKPIISWSKNVTPIYFIHWILIGWIALFLGGNSLSIIPFLLLSLIIAVVSHCGAVYYRKMRDKDREK